MKIAHLADVHIRNLERHEEYNDIFQKIIKKLRKITPDRIVIVGDLFESYIEISNEAEIIAGNFLNELSKIAKVIIVRGNHDIRKKNLNRIDSIETVVKLMNNPNVTYYDKTGFYDDKQDNNFVWVVYEHSDKDNDPWKNIKKYDGKIYIGLFHDPVLNVTSNTGKVFNDANKYKNMNYFNNNDFVLIGDIHKRQYLRNDKSAAYCGSTIQQSYGETIENHGFLLWDIKSPSDFDVTEYDIDNEHTFINLYIDESSDYDNLNLSADKIGTDTEIKVHWKEYSSIINTVNEKKIRDYIKNKFSTTKVIFEKVYLYTDILSSKMLSESIDLTDTETQKEIFNEYLEEQKYKKDDIESILKIDDIINSRVQLVECLKNTEWSIDKFWFSNFKSYGDDNVIDWADINGIVQIHGENQEGKTTILDALTYILYGKTTTTLSPEKFGDSRYINNKRDLDYVNGGAIINSNGNKFVIQRKTERVWNKNHTALTSCPTSLDFYKSENICEENKLTDEIKAKTQKELDSILGDLKDFIRLSFTNADNLNDLLSENRSVFMDNIIRDAGYDIFEIKLNEFKEYKKELVEEKLIVNIQDSESRVKELNTEIIDIKDIIDTNNSDIEKHEKELSDYNTDRDNLNKKLNNIDLSMLTFNEDLNLNTINNYESKIEESKIQSTILDRDIDKLPTEFDSSKLDEYKIKLKQTNLKISERKDEISNLKTSLLESDNKIDKVNIKIDELKQSEIRKISSKINANDLQIEVIKNNKSNIIKDEIKKITSEIQELELNLKELSSNIKLLQKDGVNAKNSNEELDKEIETFKNSKSCPSCGRDYDKNDPKYSEHLAHLEDKIKSLEIKKEPNSLIIKDCILKYKDLKNESIECNTNILNLEDMKKRLIQGEYPDDILSKLKEIGSSKKLTQDNLDLNKLIEKIENNIFDESETLNENIEKGKELIKNIEKGKLDTSIVIKNIESELKNFNVEGIDDDISIEETKKDNFELRNRKMSNRDNIILSIENFNFKIKELKLEIEKYQEYKVKIDENKIIQLSIDDVDNNIKVVKEQIKNLSQINIEMEKNIILKENDIFIISTKIKKYLKQKKKDELLKEYQKCISRDGLPTFLLKKSIHLINKELNELLINVNFTLFFDDNLNLRLSADDRLDSSQNAIESSGKERTFCALALKIALRQINVKSKSTFIVLDEIMGKLIDGKKTKSVQQFLEFIDELKNKVNKIVIIEQVHSINFDASIEVDKDEELVSHLELVY